MAFRSPLQLRRINSAGLLFSKPDISYDNVCKILFDFLHIDSSSLDGLQFVRSNKVIVKFSAKCDFDDFMERYEGQEADLPEDLGKLRILNFSKTFHFVSVKNAPFEMEDATILDILSKYGNVDSMRHNTHQRGQAQGLPNGTRTVKMVIKTNIPSSITINGHSVSFLYSGQKKTCFKCGHDDHFARECERVWGMVHHVMDEDNFPALPSLRRQESHLDVNLDTTIDTNSVTVEKENSPNGKDVNEFAEPEKTADNRIESMEKGEEDDIQTTVSDEAMVLQASEMENEINVCAELMSTDEGLQTKVTHAEVHRADTPSLLTDKINGSDSGSDIKDIGQEEIDIAPEREDDQMLVSDDQTEGYQSSSRREQHAQAKRKVNWTIKQTTGAGMKVKMARTDDRKKKSSRGKRAKK